MQTFYLKEIHQNPSKWDKSHIALFRDEVTQWVRINGVLYDTLNPADKIILEGKVHQIMLGYAKGKIIASGVNCPNLWQYEEIKTIKGLAQIAWPLN